MQWFVKIDGNLKHIRYLAWQGLNDFYTIFIEWHVQVFVWDSDLFKSCKSFIINISLNQYSKIKKSSMFETFTEIPNWTCLVFYTTLVYNMTINTSLK
jgi:hypothetical protein